MVRRAHEHILWSRVPNPGFSAIPALEGTDGSARRVVEYWAHAAAYLPISEWRFCRPRMERIRASGHEWFQADPAAVDYVRDRVAAEGPLSVRDFREPGNGGGNPGGRAFLLSPFDPLVLDRRRCARLWNFDYTMECYVPEAKRVFGYFALPLLYVPENPGQARFAGLLDAKADRKSGTLILRRLRLASRGSVSPVKMDVDPGSTDPAALASATAEELARFAAFQGTERIELEILETDNPVLDSAVRHARDPPLFLSKETPRP